MKWYAGLVGYKFVAFKSASTPDEKSHGQIYRATIGPFRTKRGAKWAETYGFLNPNFQTVNDAERMARNNTGIPTN